MGAHVTRERPSRAEGLLGASMSSTAVTERMGRAGTTARPGDEDVGGEDGDDISTEDTAVADDTDATTETTTETATATAAETTTAVATAADATATPAAAASGGYRVSFPVKGKPPRVGRQQTAVEAKMRAAREALHAASLPPAYSRVAARITAACRSEIYRQVPSVPLCVAAKGAGASPPKQTLEARRKRTNVPTCRRTTCRRTDVPTYQSHAATRV